MAQKQFKIGLSNTDKQNMAQDVYERVLALTFAEYNSAETYNEGDFVVYNDLLYKCLADNVTGTWDATKWQQATLQDLLDDVEGAVASVDGKANVDGNYPTMTVGMADNLTPYDESAGDDQDEPFILQATGTGNGTQPDFSTGSAGLMKEKQGNTVVVNQKMSSFNSQSDGGISLTPNQDGSVTLDGSANQGYSVSLYPSSTQLPLLNHTYYFDANCSDENVVVEISGYTLSRKNKGIIVNTFTDQQQFVLKVVANAVLDNVKAKPIVIDLTQWFNDDIPQDLLDNPSNFYRYYQGSLAYNEGALVNADGRYIKCIGMNQWDGTNDVKAIPNATYYINGSATLTYKDREGNTISSESKTNETFVTPSNCLSIGVSGSGDISINLYYEDEPRCLTYEPYQVLTNNDTGTEVLRSAGNVADIKLPSGEIKRNVGVVDLGTLDFTHTESAGRHIFVVSISDLRPSYNANTIINAICPLYNPTTTNATWVNMDMAYSQSSGFNTISFVNNSYTDAATFKSAMSGVYLFYELAEPTTEQGTQYSENLAIDDFGSMDFGGTNGVPQGALIFYPVDYKAFVDTLYKYTNGTPSNLALNSELNTKFESYLKSLSGYDASATQVLKNVEGTLTWVTEGE